MDITDNPVYRVLFVDEFNREFRKLIKFGELTKLAELDYNEHYELLRNDSENDILDRQVDELRDIFYARKKEFYAQCGIIEDWLRTNLVDDEVIWRIMSGIAAYYVTGWP